MEKIWSKKKKVKKFINKKIIISIFSSVNYNFNDFIKYYVNIIIFEI